MRVQPIRQVVLIIDPQCGGKRHIHIAQGQRIALGAIGLGIDFAQRQTRKLRTQRMQIQRNAVLRVFFALASLHNLGQLGDVVAADEMTVAHLHAVADHGATAGLHLCQTVKRRN
ncbi:MAG: hypothetical protein ABL934_08090 [Lysobacteraceae bacterium]